MENLLNKIRPYLSISGVGLQALKKGIQFSERTEKADFRFEYLIDWFELSKRE